MKSESIVSDSSGGNVDATSGGSAAGPDDAVTGMLALVAGGGANGEAASEGSEARAASSLRRDQRRSEKPSRVGMSAGIVTGSLKHAAHFRRNSQAGMVMVNLPTAGVDYHVPFGGRKGSSYGPREQGRYAVEFFTTVKTAYVAALV